MHGSSNRSILASPVASWALYYWSSPLWPSFEPLQIRLRHCVGSSVTGREGVPVRHPVANQSRNEITHLLSICDDTPLRLVARACCLSDQSRTHFEYLSLLVPSSEAFVYQSSAISPANTLHIVNQYIPITLSNPTRCQVPRRRISLS